MPVSLRIPVAAAFGTAALLVSAAPALALSGETLSLSLSGPAVAGGVTSFVASGADMDESVGGYNLDVFTKPVAVDPTCAPTDDGEDQSWMADMANEHHPVVGLVETIDPGPFSVAFKNNFPQAGAQLVCAYSVGLEGAASAQLTVNVQPAGGSGGPPSGGSGGSGGSAAAAKPVVVRRPRVVRSGRRLTCRRGTWTGATRFSYRWLVGGHVRGHGPRLRISRALGGRTVSCGVTGSDAAGATFVLSKPYRVR